MFFYSSLNLQFSSLIVLTIKDCLKDTLNYQMLQVEQYSCFWQYHSPYDQYGQIFHFQDLNNIKTRSFIPSIYYHFKIYFKQYMFIHKFRHSIGLSQDVINSIKLHKAQSQMNLDAQLNLHNLNLKTLQIQTVQFSLCKFLNSFSTKFQFKFKCIQLIDSAFTRIQKTILNSLLSGVTYPAHYQLELMDYHNSNSKIHEGPSKFTINSCPKQVTHLQSWKLLIVLFIFYNYGLLFSYFIRFNLFRFTKLSEQICRFKQQFCYLQRLIKKIFHIIKNTNASFCQVVTQIIKLHQNTFQFTLLIKLTFTIPNINNYYAFKKFNTKSFIQISQSIQIQGMTIRKRNLWQNNKKKWL
ncbi:unnamed protein product (macronuclear) [Paramecium tetraurelia]|uniref:Transmembrane protein n=1 Tax=Paramecium tetraurelia TaxID=5888 RepID=A0BW06_PARTE|nr:uncharacterized protein GSPATT00032575001 [Paramecium tetraurelia]CAK62723.1 unnamed protein product [Paramecium tetraurelia]|eukprot:XP_001430121.1 hypothetical protein (macronuclear) [Paramecium tetraurelia strain d4-2]